MTVMMRSMLEVADNSGARKLQMILPLGGATGLRAGLGDVVTASVKEAAQRASPPRWNLYPLRSECGGADQRSRRAGGNARVRPGGKRIEGKEVFEDCEFGAGSFVEQVSVFRRFQSFVRKPETDG